MPAIVGTSFGGPSSGSRGWRSRASSSPKPAAIMGTAENHWRPPSSAQALEEPPTTPASHQGAVVGAPAGRPPVVRRVRCPGRRARRRDTARCAGPPAPGRGPAAPPAGMRPRNQRPRGRRRREAVQHQETRGQEQGGDRVAVQSGAAQGAPATASPAAHAARTSSELRSPLRAARRENQVAAAARATRSSRAAIPPYTDATPAPALTSRTAPTPRITWAGRAR